jgi:FtsH-binding integral membrane protein
MQLRTVFLALAAGVATTLLVGAAVTEALLPAIEFSAIVGLPVGLAAGLLVGALVLVALAGRNTRPVNRHAAMAVGVCGLVILAVFAIAVFAVDLGALVGITVGAVVGTIVGTGVFVWLQQGDDRNVHAVTSR